MSKLHRYVVTVKWTGNTGSGTSNYRSYERSHEITTDDQGSAILGSSDPAFRGDSTRWNPEELLVASLSACHKLWYLHLCAVSGIVVLDYIDHAEGYLEESEDGSGRFARVVLKPQVKISSSSDVKKALSLHEPAHAKCFIANSVNFAVLHEPEIKVA